MYNYRPAGQDYNAPAGRSGSNSTYNFQNAAGTPAVRRQGQNAPIGSSGRAVYGGGQAYGMQAQPIGQPRANFNQYQHQGQRNYGNSYQGQGQSGMTRTRSTPGMPQGMMPVQPSPGSPAGMRTYATSGGIPPEIEGNPNVQYVRMNWEDILGGKGGANGLQVSLAPGNGDPNANRQIRVGMGGAEGPTDGTPLRIVSFQPVENYPGLKEPTAVQPGQPKFSVYTGTPSPLGQGQVQGQGQGPQITRQRPNGGNVYSTNMNNRR